MQEIDISLDFERQFEGRLNAARAAAEVGTGEGRLRPYDMLLGALGACYYSTFVDIADKMRLEYEGANIAVHGVKRDEVPTTLKEVEMVFTIKGAKDEKGFARAGELAAKYCSVHDTVSKVADIHLELRFSQI